MVAKLRTLFVLVLASTLGVVAAGALLPRHAAACSCARPVWQLELESLEPEDDSHAQHWPRAGTFEEFNGPVSFNGNGYADGVISYLRAE
jgi:hypothetical protein